MVDIPGVLGRQAAFVTWGHVTFEDMLVFFSWEEWGLLGKVQRLSLRALPFWPSWVRFSVF